LKDQNIIYPEIKISLTTPQISCDAIIGTGKLVSTADLQDDTNPNYTFEWFPSLDLTGTSFAATSTVDSLKAGNYSLQVRDLTSGCTSSSLYIVPDNAPQFLPQLILSSFERTLCVGQDGMVLASIINRDDYPFKSSLSYKVDLFFGNKVGDPALPTLTPDRSPLPNVPGSQQNFTSGDSAPDRLAEGFYTVRILDNNTGCIDVKAEEVKDGRKNPVVVIKEESPMINCDVTIADGQLLATDDKNQVLGYQFDWYKGTTVPLTQPIDTVSRLIGQVAGDYVVRVTRELTGCFSDKVGKITDGRVFPPAPVALVVKDKTNCLITDSPAGTQATGNGWVFAHVDCSTIKHTFKWSDGATTKATPDFIGANYFDRGAGSFTVTATDVITLCESKPATVEVKDLSVIPSVVLTSTPELCIKQNGSITLEHTNSQANIKEVNLCDDKFIIDTSVALADIEWFDASNTPIGTGVEIFGLEAGTYHVEVTTLEGCKATATTEVATEILSYNLVSINGDGANDVWIVDCLEKFPTNNVKVFNRSGIKVYEADGYDNATVVFKGIGENGVYFLGDKLPDGTYFYIIDKRDGSKPVTGYLELVR
jgi:gliding motility-associated-like protein